MKRDKDLVIIAGASRGIGKAFYEYYKRQGDEIERLVGITRKADRELQKCDLMDFNQTRKFAYGLNMSDQTHVTYVHSIGMDKFEPKGQPHIDNDCDGIDDEVYASNVITYKNIMEPLLHMIDISNASLTTCTFGSVSDVYQVPFWQSFWKSKNEIRKFNKVISSGNIYNVMFNLSSTLDEKGNKYGRKNADTHFWQSAMDVAIVAKSVIDDMQNSFANYVEQDLFCPNPEFRQDHFTNLPRLYSVWQKDMGFEGKEIPPNIRI